jgi:hypothetical protein
MSPRRTVRFTALALCVAPACSDEGPVVEIDVREGGPGEGGGGGAPTCAQLGPVSAAR